RAHRIGTVKTHARRRSSHRQRLVAFEERQFFSGVGQRECERFEMRASIVVTGAGHADVFSDDGLPFSFELQSEDVFEDLELDADQAQHRRQSNGVLNQISSDVWRQLLHRKGTKLDAGSDLAGFDLVAVIENGRARLHQSEVPIHRVLIEGNQNVELVTESENRFIAGAKREENVAAANDRLVRIIGVQVQPAADEYSRQDIAGRGDSLTRCAADCNREIDFCHTESPFWLFELYLT